jgi:Ca2+-binding EF-hand superfamily protein
MEYRMTSISGVGGFRPPPPGKPPSFEKLDGNSDGALSLDELKAGAPKGADSAKSEELFKKIDADGDGSITKAESEEFRAKREEAQQQVQSFLLNLQSLLSGTQSEEDGEDGESLFAKLDGNSDGSVAKDEFLNAISPDGDGANGLINRLFAAMDADKSGEISEQELADFQKKLEERASNRPPPPAAANGVSAAYGQIFQLGAQTSAGATYSQAA